PVERFIHRKHPSDPFLFPVLVLHYYINTIAIHLCHIPHPACHSRTIHYIVWHGLVFPCLLSLERIGKCINYLTDPISL
ncbi:hypothetical protein BDF14DRAFT_1737519, partial [Spinellus fusiger]